MIRIPSLFVLRPLLASLLFIWLACHLAVSAVLSVGGSALQAIWPGPVGSIVLVPLVPFLFFLDLRIKRLDVFLANLGVSRRFLTLGALLLVFGLEVLGSVIAGFFPGSPAFQ